MPTVTELRQQLASIQAAILNKTNIINDRQNMVDSRLTNLNRKISEHNTDEINYSAALNAYGQKLQAQQTKKNAHNQQVDNLAQEMNAYNNSVTIQRQKITDYNEQYNELNQEIARYNELIQDSNANANEIAALKNHILNEKTRLQQVLSAINAENQRLRQSITTINTKRDALAREKDDLDEVDRNLREEIQSITAWGDRKQVIASQINQEQADINQEMGSIQSLHAELNQLLSISESLKRQISELENADDNLIVSKGQFTFDAEGNEGGPYHSRKPHVPTNTSGLTIGRGYDLKERTVSSVISDLHNIGGMDETTAQVFSGACGLAGNTAKNYIQNNNLTNVEITLLGQKNLFNKVYNELESDVIRICNKADTIEKYGQTDWNTLHPKIKDMVVDLRFRGDYTTQTRTFLQKLISSNNLEEFANVISDPTKWSTVPHDRFVRRAAYFSGDIHPLIHPLNLKNIANTRLKLFAAPRGGDTGIYTLSNLNKVFYTSAVINIANEPNKIPPSIVEGHANSLTRVFSDASDVSKIDDDNSKRDIYADVAGATSFATT